MGSLSTTVKTDDEYFLSYPTNEELPRLTEYIAKVNRRKRMCGSASKLPPLVLPPKPSFSTATESAQGSFPRSAHDALFTGALALLKARSRPSAVLSSSSSSSSSLQEEPGNDEVLRT